MGLLSKVVSGSPQELDEMGKALRDRLLRLERKKTSPYTALSLLKAYGSFQIGICLALEGRNYVSYAAVGLGLTRVVIPLELLSPLQEGMRLLETDLPQLNGKTENWTFPLDSQDPCAYLCVIGVEKSAKWSAPLVGAILTQTGHIFRLPDVPEVESEPQPPDISPKEDEELLDILDISQKDVDLSLDADIQDAFDEPEVLTDESYAAYISELSPDDGKIRAMIDAYAESAGEFQGIALELPEDLDPRNIDDFYQLLTSMTASFGKVLRLPSGRALILMAPKYDQELISFHLARVLKTLRLTSFLTDNSDTALIAIQPYL